jgi:hypothetical protein
MSVEEIIRNCLKQLSRWYKIIYIIHIYKKYLKIKEE